MVTMSWCGKTAQYRRQIENKFNNQERHNYFTIEIIVVCKEHKEEGDTPLSFNDDPANTYCQVVVSGVEDFI